MPAIVSYALCALQAGPPAGADTQVDRNSSDLANMTLTEDWGAKQVLTVVVREGQEKSRAFVGFFVAANARVLGSTEFIQFKRCYGSGMMPVHSASCIKFNATIRDSLRASELVGKQCGRALI